MGRDFHFPHSVSSNGLCGVPVEIYGGENFPILEPVITPRAPKKFFRIQFTYFGVRIKPLV